MSYSDRCATGADIANNPAYVNRVITTGNQRARQIAEHTLAQAHNALGMPYANL